jgi:SAM-dependent methyltransferase
VTTEAAADAGTASSAAARLARYYDLDLQGGPDDLDRYLRLAAAEDGPVLELAAGTGRLAIPLALAGHAVTGADIDPAMLERARAAWARAAAGAAPGGSLELIEADLLSLGLETRFGLVVLALNSLFLLGTHDRQQTALAVMARHLRPGGLAVVDIWLPHPDDLALYDGRLVLEWQRDDRETGERVAKLHAARFDSANGEVELDALFDIWPAKGGPVGRVSRTDHLRLVSAGELAAMAEAAGLVVEAIEGDHLGTPFGPGAERAVLLARLV